MTSGLAVAEEPYRLLFDRNPTPMWVCDRTTLAFLDVNRAAVRHYGYARDEFLRMKLQDIRPDEDVPGLMRFIEELGHCNTDEPFSAGTWRHRTKAGTLISVEITLSRLPFHGREAYLVSSLDVTERRRAVQALEASVALNRRIIEAVPGGVVHVSMDGSIRTANAEARRILGLSWDEMAGRYVMDWDPETIREDGSPYPAEDYPVTRCLRTGQPQPRSVVGVRRPDRSVSWALYTAIPLLDPVTGVLSGAVVTFLDITERKRAEEARLRAEEALGANEIRFQTFMENIPAVAFMKDEQGRYVYANRQLEPVTGRSLADTIGKTDYDLFPKDIADQLRANDELARTSNETFDFNENPANRSWRVLKFPITDAAGSRLLGGMAFDVTAQHQSAEALRESEERLRRFFEAAFEGIALHEGGRILDANQPLADIFGYNIHELIGMNVLDLAAPESRDRVRDHVVSGYGLPYEAFGLRKDGSRFPGEICGKNIPYRGRTVRVTVLRDITALKRVEADLRATKDHLDHLLSCSPAFLYSLQKQPDGFRTIWVSDNITRIMGYTTAEVMAPGWWIDHVHPEDRPRVVANQALLFADDQLTHEYRIQHRDGSFRWVRDELRLIRDGAGEAFEIVGAWSDVTAQKKAEEERERLFEQVRAGRERLEDLSRRLLAVQETERRHLARELHDEIGSSITGLQMTLSGRLDAEGTAAALARAQALLRELTNRTRDLSLRLRPTMLDDLGLPPALVWLIERFSVQTGVRVNFEHEGLESRLPAEVETAGYRIIQEALTNIARHAAAKEATVRVWCEAGHLHVQVEDFGTGFRPADALQRGGSGGLSGMQERARLLGGHLAIDAQPGRGTCVTAELPLQQDHRHDPQNRPGR